MWTNEERSFCVEAYILTSLDETRRRFLKKFHFDHRRIDRAPGKKAIKRWVARFRSTGNVSDSKPVGRCRTIRTDENIQRVSESVFQSPKRSLRKRSQSLGINRHTLWQIKKDLKLRPYMLTSHHELTPRDMQRRVDMAEWFDENPDVLDRLWFSDEAHFFLAGAMNPNNTVHWGKKRPDEVRSTPPHSQKVMAWIAMRRGGGLIGPFFFEDERGHAVTVTTQRYLSTALEPFLEELKQIEGIDHKTE